MSKIDLWPEINIEANEDEPIKILRDQAEILGKKTKNLITGDVVTNTESGVIYHTLYLVAPILDNYRYSLLKIAHTSRQYPLFIYDFSKERSGIKSRRTYKPAIAGRVAEASSRMSIGQLYEIDEIIIPEPDKKVNSPDEFKKELKKILQSAETISIINSLVTQSL